MTFGFRKKRPTESEIEAELAFHLAQDAERRTGEGAESHEAIRQSALSFGGVTQVTEEVRDVHRLVRMENLLRNLRSGWRLLRKSPSFSVTVIVTLALGIGANSAVFSAIDAILLRALPFPHGDELVVMGQFESQSRNPASFVAPQRLEDWNRLNETMQAISGFYTEDASETSGALPEKLTEALVAPRFFQVWGVSPALGRDFSPAEEHFGGPNAAIISDRLWRRRFAASNNVIGKRLRIEHASYTIIGVMPAAFSFPDRDAELWVSSPPDAPYAQDRNATWFRVIGRLKPGVTLQQARSNLSNVQAQLGRQFPKSDAHLSVEVRSMKESDVAASRRSLWLLFGSVTVLLLISCTNIAAMLLCTDRKDG